MPRLLLLLVFFISPAHAGDNPSAPGFNAAGSDPKAIALADEVMAAMGGRAN